MNFYRVSVTAHVIYSAAYNGGDAEFAKKTAIDEYKDSMPEDFDIPLSAEVTGILTVSFPCICKVQEWNKEISTHELHNDRELQNLLDKIPHKDGMQVYIGEGDAQMIMNLKDSWRVTKIIFGKAQEAHN